MRQSHGPVESLLLDNRLAPAPSGVLIGLVGRGIQASRTPGMHEREGARLGLPYTYVLIDFDTLGLSDDRLDDVLKEAARFGFSGLNVTHPFKQAVLASVESIADEARAIGAVNTIVFDAEGRASGHNTDSWGFAESFRRGLAGAPAGNIVLFGAGGAGAAVAHALMTLGAETLSIVDTDGGRAERLVTRMAPGFGNRIVAGDDAEQALSMADGIVNATPVGMAKYPGVPFPLALLEPRHWVADIIYFPPETELLRQARALGCRILPGAGMAIFQAVRAFELFTGRKADSDAMASHFEAAA